MDTSELDRLAVNLGDAGFRATQGARKVIERAAMKVKAGMAQDFTGHAHAPAIPRAINYTIRGLNVEIGVDKDGPQGGLGNILAFGTSKNAAVVDHTAALRRELPNVEEWLAKAGTDALP